MSKWRVLLCVIAGSVLCGASACQTLGADWPAGEARPFDGTFSLLTYNVKGGPWPVAWNRTESLAAIGDELRRMRAAGRNPQVVVLQEAFSTDARSIARRAGYRYVVSGPSAEDRDLAPPSAPDMRYLANGHWWLGEMGVRVLDSGLLLLSDYPVARVRRIAYPDFACAGLDCMANKGALMVTLRVPGAPAPIDILTTHLNSRRHARVSDDRSLQAYRRQVGLLARFVAANRDPDHPLIAAGDFNVGTAPGRGDALSASLARWSFGGRIDHALHAIAAARRARGQGVGADAEAAIRRNTDFVFFAAGRSAGLVPVAVDVPFGPDARGNMLSDHIGYAATFRLTPGGTLSSPVQVRGGAGGRAR